MNLIKARSFQVKFCKLKLNSVILDDVELDEVNQTKIILGLMRLSQIE